LNSWLKEVNPKALDAFHYFVVWEDFSGLEYEDLEDEASSFNLSWEDCEKILYWWADSDGNKSIRLFIDSFRDFLLEVYESEETSETDEEYFQALEDTFDNLPWDFGAYFQMAVYGYSNPSDFEDFARRVEGECGLELDEAYQKVGKIQLKKWLEATDLDSLWNQVHKTAKDEILRINKLSHN
jgi:hypothetical protein